MSTYENFSPATNEMLSRLHDTLFSVLPEGFWLEIWPVKVIGSEMIRVQFGPTKYEISNVKGQYPAVVSLALWMQDLQLKPQVFGGNGGQSVYITSNDPFLALQHFNVPFRKPKPRADLICNAARKFAQNYLKLMIEHVDRLRFTEHYSEGARKYLGIK